MKILAISSSPRRHGNSETLLDDVLTVVMGKGIVVKKVVLSNLKIAPCNSCQTCLKTGECVIKDDMQVLYKDLLSTDVLLVASPIYFKGLPCQLKCVIDRCQALWAKKYVLSRRGLNPSYKKCKKAKRIGTAILVSASSGVKDIHLRQGYGGLSPEALAKGDIRLRQGYGGLSSEALAKEDMFLGAIIVLKAWFKTLDFVYKKEFLAQGLEEKSDALKDAVLIKKVVEFGKKIVREG